VPRYLSFKLTEPQFMGGSKSVTRRLGWRFLVPSELLCGVRQSQGMRKGEKAVRLG
jgi:hypothetical protein